MSTWVPKLFLKNTWSTFGVLDDVITRCNLLSLNALLKRLRHASANLTVWVLLPNSRIWELVLEFFGGCFLQKDFFFPVGYYAWWLSDASNCFHTLHMLQRMIKTRFLQKKKILYSKDMEFTNHSKIKTGFLQKNKNPMPLMRLKTHLGKLNNNLSNLLQP